MKLKSKEKVKMKLRVRIGSLFLQQSWKKHIKKFKETNGFAYSFHPKPLEIILKTSLSKGEETEEQAERIEEYARQVVEIKRKELSVESNTI
ncbi:hypothetical protein RCO48_20155 [Peribacillus frigoritolerans]|nr:hypothetical protein [Peribacillus frigoritolerans]